MKKFGLEEDNECNGRSMIEMLGVLAIIGVLSVGGIAGYSEVMRKFKVNKTIEIFRDSLFRLSELEAMNWNNDADAGEISEYVDFGLLPESICDENYIDVHGDKGDVCQLPIGEIYMEFAFSNKHLMVGWYDILLTGNDMVKNCIDFLSYHWEQKTPKEWWQAGDGYEGGHISVIGTSELKHIYGSEQEYNKSTELTMSSIAQGCSLCKNSEYCVINIVLRNDL